MNIASELKPSSLAERIAKVRNRMFVATLIPPSNKELFTALCQIYEQHDTEEAFFSSESSDDSLLSLQALAFAHKIPENMREQWPERMLRKTFSQQQIGSDYSDNDDDFDDWDKRA
jgi:hypothetical protein